MALIKLNADTYKDLVNEYKKIIDDAAKAEKLGSQLAWHQFFLKKLAHLKVMIITARLLELNLQLITYQMQDLN